MADREYKRPALHPGTYRRLDVYRAGNGRNSIIGTVADLLVHIDQGGR